MKKFYNGIDHESRKSNRKVQIGMDTLSDFGWTGREGFRRYVGLGMGHWKTRAGDRCIHWQGSNPLITGMP